MNEEIQKILDSAYVQMLQALLKTHSGTEGTCVLQDHIIALSQQLLPEEQQRCVRAIIDAYIVCLNLDGMYKR